LKKKTIVKRKGVEFLAAYIPDELKASLRRRAASAHRTMSQEVVVILSEAIHGVGLPPGSIDRRMNTSPPRRRDIDPFPPATQG
jgi:hypothetical protein